MNDGLADEISVVDTIKEGISYEKNRLGLNFGGVGRGCSNQALFWFRFNNNKLFMILQVLL
jgi:hypothetical protein